MGSTRQLDDWMRTVLSRRAMLAGGLVLFGLPRARLLSAGVRQASPTAGQPFTLGVASGDPTPDGVVLWTRLAPTPLEGGGMPPEPVAVGWEVASDERFAGIVQTGTITARPEHAHAVHIEVDGLEPDRWYWYRFHAGASVSPVGRTRTLPRPSALVDRLRFAFCSCQHYEQGYYTAFRHMAAEDLDLIFHLGDYIYEGPGTDGRVRTHSSAEIVTLDDYRNRYAQYKTDPDLQAAHATCPWILTWDDHEVDNNYAGEVSERYDPREVFLARRAAAYQAYYEHMPLRRTSMPRGPALQLYRQFRYGDLTSFFVLDERQYRSDQPCGDGTKAPCDEVTSAAATLLGADQERWLLDALDQSRTRWNVLPQQVMLARVDRQRGDGERLSMDQWSGYEAARRRLLGFLGERKPANPVVLTGDIHSNWVNDLVVELANSGEQIVGTEFVVTSISSGGDGVDVPGNAAAILAENPFVTFHNGERGYVSCDLAPGGLDARYRTVDFVTRPDSPIRTRASFHVESGRPGAVRA